MALTAVSNNQLSAALTSQEQQIDLSAATAYLLTKFDTTRYRSVATHSTPHQRLLNDNHIVIDDTPIIDVWIIGPDSLTWAKAAEEQLDYVQVTTTTVGPHEDILLTLRLARDQYMYDHDVIILAEIQLSASVLDICMACLRRGGCVDVYGFGDVALTLPEHQQVVNFPSYFTHGPLRTAVRMWIQSQMSAPNEYHTWPLVVQPEPWLKAITNEDVRQECQKRSVFSSRRSWLMKECLRHLSQRRSTSENQQRAWVANLQTLYNTLQAENTKYKVHITTLRLVIYKPNAERLSIRQIPRSPTMALSRDVSGTVAPDQISPVPSMRPISSERHVHRRSKTGCLTCRIRRMKCDERRPICLNCTRALRYCQPYVAN